MKPKRPRDPSQLAKRIVEIATGEFIEPLDNRNPNAVAMGKKGGKARAENMTAEQRSEIAKHAADKRWRK